MPDPPPGRQRRRLMLAGPSSSRLARVLGAAAAAAAVSLLPLLAAAPALAGAATASKPGSGLPVRLAITSVSPAYARPGQAVTVAGWVRNGSAGAIRDASVSLEYSPVPFTTMDALQAFANRTGSTTEQALPGTTVRISWLARGATRWWRIRVPASQLQLSCFGVYPLSAQLTGSLGAALAAPDQTLLPYWPARAAPCPGSPRPVRDNVAWIWPLIDQPHQAACHALLDNGLAASLRPGGRLRTLLTAGLAYAARARLTWAIDPAVLDNARTMTSPYLAGGGSGCHGGTQLPASKAAAAWLTDLIKGTAGQPAFVTPYADVDIAALAAGLGGDLAQAFRDGRQLAGSILARQSSPGPAARGRPGSPLSSIAWPADGVANYPVLENLAPNQVSAVILDSSTMPPVPPLHYTPTAVTSTPDGVAGEMRVLLSDHGLTQLLGSPRARSASPADVFYVRQLFLAETAMIAAEAPNLARAIVVAPPRRWDPPASLADGLLAATTSAPWLRPARAASLLAGKAAQAGPARQPPASVSPDELSARLLRRLARLDRQVHLLGSVGLPQSAQALNRVHALDRAVFAIESSAWRGRAGANAETLLQGTSAYVRTQLGKLTIFGTKRYTLGGLGGTVRISVSNRLGYPVNVRLSIKVLTQPALTASPGSITVAGGDLVTAAGQVTTVKIGVQAVSAGSTVIRVSLRAPDGTALPAAPLQVTVQATHYGRLALIIGAAALAIFMISSAARALRRERPGSAGPGKPGPPRRGPDPEPGGGRAPEARSDRPAGSSRADNVLADGPGPRAASRTDAHGGLVTRRPKATEGADELARVPSPTERG